MSKAIEIKKLGLVDLIALRNYLAGRAYSSPVRETERQAEKRFAEQEVLGETLKRIDLELKKRTREII